MPHFNDILNTILMSCKFLELRNSNPCTGHRLVALKDEGDETWEPQNSIDIVQLYMRSARQFWKVHLKWKLLLIFEIYTTVTLPKPTVARRSVSKKWENRATSADNRPTSAPILANFLVGRRLFCRSTQVKSFVDRSADFHGFCHRWSVGRWSPDDRPTIGRHFEDFFIIISAEGRPIIGRQSADDRQTVGR